MVNQEAPSVCDCGHEPSPCKSFTTGYGTDPETGKRYCYACCAVRDVESMRETGRAVLYLVRGKVGERWRVTNWPESLSFPAYGVKRKPRGGGFGAERIDAYFNGPDGYVWHAVNRGDNQIARCKRTKQRIATPSASA